MNTPNNRQSRKIKENECSDTWISFQESEDLPKQPNNLGEYEQLSLWKLTPMPNEYYAQTSQISPSTPISETTTQEKENSTLLQWDGRVQARVTQEIKQDSNIQLPHSGEKDLEYYSKPNPASVLWNNLKDLSDEEGELFLPASIWQDTVGKLKQSRRRSLGQDTKDSEYLSFPTLTSGQTSSKMRPAGQVKCEKWFRDNGLIPNGYQLGTRAIALVMGFPSNWFEGLSQKNSNQKIISSQVKPQAESEQDISQVEQLHQHKQPSPSAESSISIPCLIKQPKQPEVKGVIQKDLGDRFDIYIPHLDKSIAVSKLFVYPDFSESVGQIDKSPSQNLTTSTQSPRKKRRRRGEGNGAIYYRTVTKNNGKQYQEAYYHWRENGKKRTKYIPKKLLDRVKEAEQGKLPVSDILVLLVGKEKSPRKSSDTLSQTIEEKVKHGCTEPEVLETSEESPRKNLPTSKTRRTKGKGSGWIQCKPIKRSGKEYQQYWYNYEEWKDGERIIKKSRYIPKNKVSKVERMNNEKAPVEKILKVLQNRTKRKRR